MDSATYFIVNPEDVLDGEELDLYFDEMEYRDQQQLPYVPVRLWKKARAEAQKSNPVVVVDDGPAECPF